MRKRRKDLSLDELARKELIKEYLSKMPNNKGCCKFISILFC